ncbi:hypothetical protein R3P38DRAFT_3184606 [Favolaschia claudopus]|uniref:Uncharacterized protein n=1 Tax=Favolaschia claudopus TaxID=2862362 RepID=A0AAW0C9Z4_9AGAR
MLSKSISPTHAFVFFKFIFIVSFLTSSETVPGFVSAMQARAKCGASVRIVLGFLEDVGSEIEEEVVDFCVGAQSKARFPVVAREQWGLDIIGFIVRVGVSIVFSLPSLYCTSLYGGNRHGNGGVGCVASF